MDQIIGNLIVRLEVIDSTNNYAKQQIRENKLAEGTVFLTYEQTSGRGQQKNVWESEPRQNLLFSIVLCPDFVELRRQFQLSKIISLGIYNAINKYVSGVKIKWPNDIYVGDKKIAGILIENSFSGPALDVTVVGIGLNLNQTEFPPDLPNPISMLQLTGVEHRPEIVLRELIVSIQMRYLQLKFGLRDKVSNEYLNSLYRFNVTSRFSDSDGIFNAKIIGIHSTGELILETEQKQQKYYAFKEVSYEI